MIDNYPEATLSQTQLDDLTSTFDGCLVNGLPTMFGEQWQSVNSKYDKGIIREALIIYLMENKSPFPYKNIGISEVAKLFRRLSDLKSTNLVKVVEKKQFGDLNIKAVCKFKDDAEYFTKEGNLIIDTTHQYNRGSDFFQQINRYNCGTWSFDSPINNWKTWRGLKGILGPVWRMGGNELSIDMYISGIRLGLYNATQFKPPVAKVMYDIFKADTVYDISCGWGDRLFGFYVSNAKEYYGCDPNPDTYLKYKEQCKEYQRLLSDEYEFIEGKDKFTVKGSLKTVRIWNLPAEDLDYDLLPEIDLIFSSPPYFATEKYAEDNCETQSWFRYKLHKDWQENFLYNVIDKCKTRLSNTGTMAINIIDGSIKGERQDICRPMIDRYSEMYRGQIGMTLSQRPNTVLKRYIDRNEGETNEDYTARVAIEEKKVVSNVPYIEPIFVFSNTDIKLDRSLIKETEDIDDLFD